jgi:hypothetical protein
MPGVSMSKTFSFAGAPKKLVRIHSTLVVSDFIELDDLKIVSPHNEFPVDDFPCPVTPMRQTDLKLLDIVLKSTHLFLNKSARWGFTFLMIFNSS